MSEWAVSTQQEFCAQPEGEESERVSNTCVVILGGPKNEEEEEGCIDPWLLELSETYGCLLHLKKNIFFWVTLPRILINKDEFNFLGSCTTTIVFLVAIAIKV